MLLGGMVVMFIGGLLCVCSSVRYLCMVVSMFSVR